MQHSTPAEQRQVASSVSRPASSFHRGHHERHNVRMIIDLGESPKKTTRHHALCLMHDLYVLFFDNFQA